MIHDQKFVKPFTVLMVEHGLIRRMIGLMETVEALLEKDYFCPLPWWEAVEVFNDFFTIYVNRCHQQKEEQILYRILLKKNEGPYHQSLIKELIFDHQRTKKMTEDLKLLEEISGNSDDSCWHHTKGVITEIKTNYDLHIQTEEKNFFIWANYLRNPELEQMMEEFWEFDRFLIHKKYKKIIEDVEEKIKVEKNQLMVAFNYSI